MKFINTFRQLWSQRSKPDTPALIALILIIILDFLLSDALTVEILPPLIDRVLFVILLTMILFVFTCWLFSLSTFIRKIVISILMIVAAKLAFGVFLLVFTLMEQKGDSDAIPLILDSFILWTTNFLISAVWYWFIDGGGSKARERPGEYQPDFWFLLQSEDHNIPIWRNNDKWVPGFFDYLFLAFNTSVALSPTDTQIISVRAKILTMIQSITSLIVLVILAARAVNILK